MQPVWAARTGSAIDAGFLAFSQTVQDDAPYVAHDVAGSIAHVLGLHHVGLLDAREAKQLVAGLQDIAAAWETGGFVLDPALEDVHMNIEAALTATLGETGKKLHTGRSRNDQVATCITLYARAGLASVADNLGHLVAALLAQATTHHQTPWVARTHGQVAQPATVGFLLAAHAARLQDAQTRVLQAFDAIGESPLGAGAVAGSTLPLDPTFTANLLGLRPIRSALLATGARETVWTTCNAAVQAGRAIASLAEDLLQLFGAKALKLPASLTTGSSLMPQKRNPDALELVRGKANSLQGPLASVTAITSGLGLGYMRDLQATKPSLTSAVTDTVGCLQVLTACVQGAQFDVPLLAATLQAPGITATDVAEALVGTGMAFRDAYALVAKAYAAVESGATLADALAATGLPAAQLAAAVAACAPNPALRTTRGGPAPSAVKATISELATTHDALATAVQEAHAATQVPVQMVANPPEVAA